MTGFQDLIDAVRSTGPGPCQGCVNAPLCGAQKLACKDYYVWFDGAPIQHEDRVPSRIWMLRVDEDEDTVVGGFKAYWAGVKAWCDHRQAARAHAPEDADHRDWFLAGVQDGERYDVRRMYHWKMANRRPLKVERREREEALGIADLLRRTRPITPPTEAERVVGQIAQAAEPMAVFWLGGGRWETMPARKRTTQNRIDNHPRAFVGVFNPNCPPEWILESLKESVL